MKKVGIVSCYFKNNYGSMLQAYATKETLDNNNIPNETIYKEFRKDFNLSRSSNTYKDLSDLASERYSDIILGSDQLWLPVNVVADYYTLNWAPKEINKISYSTSFGVSIIPKKYEKMYSDFLKKINNLSVREDTGVKLVKDLSNIEAKLVCDPTILLTREEWNKVAVSERIIQDKYILCYFLGNNIEHRKFAERLKTKTGYKIVSLNHADEYVKYSDTFCDIAPYDIGPKEWINLIKNAEYVCTDSFHGTVFSLIYNKMFFNFRRYSSKTKGSTNSRLDSLLKIVEVSNERILSGNENVEDVLKYNIDFDRVNKNLDKFREDSKKWLLDSITWKNDNIKHINITSKEDCTGCTACMNKCPKNAISMVRDEEGFLYPQVNKRLCVDCSLCKKVCPVKKQNMKNDFIQKAYIFQNLNKSVREDSTSGGFSSAIGEYIIKNNGVCFGAAFDKKFKVVHQKAENIEELQKFRKSKYVQSDLNDIFKQIKQLLEKNFLVCFTGTPCQVAGLNAFLGKKYENLILIDIMCHSVPSPLVFEKYKEYILKKLNANKILDINFRDKSKYGYKYSMMTVDTDKGKYSEGIDTDPYLRAFFGDYSVRPSCYNCHFKIQERVSDITIWYCFNINELDKSFDDDIGTTRILIQSEKGLEVLNKLDNIKIKELIVDMAVDKVKEMTKSVSYNSRRNEFFDNINSENVFEKWFPKNIKTYLNGVVRKFLSITGMYNSIKSFTKKLLRK